MNAKLLTGMGLALALGACVSSPQPNAALESAHAAVQAAESDPNVSKYAALDLEAAKKDLAIADDAALHHRDAEPSHSPPTWRRRTHAWRRCTAAAKADDARVAAGQAERDRIMLAARNREVQNAKGDQRRAGPARSGDEEAPRATEELRGCRRKSISSRRHRPRADWC